MFLHLRIAFWVAASLPVSFFGMFILAAWWGITVNVISLFGMIVVVGILVDDGIVVSENIYAHYERGKNPLRAAIDGIMEVLPAVFSAVLTTIIAFSAFFFLDGRSGELLPLCLFRLLKLSSFFRHTWRTARPLKVMGKRIFSKNSPID
jgi:multidrug efflux pump subunit AcrB